ncbi:PQQ-binding-like beta-propeller repeat protein [Streptomyces sp. NPDC056255]|uniref:outer membrane protein assembly factor BamB family protein n=1 Tax=Streptomyces sp. NPDC056255 TaxID=3345764 RepID=UPI0035E1F4C6
MATAGVSAGVYLTAGPEHDPFAGSYKLGSEHGCYDQPVRSGGRCFVSAHDSAVIQAFALGSGQRLWRLDLGPAWPMHAGPEVAAIDGGDTVIAPAQLSDSRSSMLYLLDGATGKTRRKLGQYDTDSNALRVLDRSELVLFGSDNSNSQFITALDPRTGKERWNQSVHGANSVTAIGDLALVGSTALDGATGKNMWEQPLMNRYVEWEVPCAAANKQRRSRPRAGQEAPRRSRPAQSTHGTGEVAYPSVQDHDRARCILDQDPPAAPLSGTTFLLPRLEGERSSPTAIDVRTGKQKWTFKGDAGFVDRKHGPVSTPDGFVLVTPDGVVRLSAEDGTERWPAKGGEDLCIDGAGNYTMVRHSHTARLFQRRETVRIFRSTDGRALWQGGFEWGRNNSAPLAAGRVLAFLDPLETLRAIRLTG